MAVMTKADKEEAGKGKVVAIRATIMAVVTVVVMEAPVATVEALVEVVAEVIVMMEARSDAKEHSHRRRCGSAT